MTMPIGNAVISDKMQFPSSVAGQWFPDERDSFISWLRGEFAAANAMIDSLCHHLRFIGEPGEYDFVLNCIQQRRNNWIQVLHMQHYYSIAEVMNALQQATWRRQQKLLERPNVADKAFRKSGSRYRQLHMVESFREIHSNASDAESSSQSISSVANVEKEVKRENREKAKEMSKAVSQSDIASQADSTMINGGNSSENKFDNLGSEEMKASHNSFLKGPSHNYLQENGENNVKNEDEEHNSFPVPQSFDATETLNQRMVNVVEGLQLYDKLLESSEISKLVSIVNELRAAGQRGELQGQTYVVSKRPMKGHGREMIQLGVPIADGPPGDENANVTSKDHQMVAMPSLLRNIIDRFTYLQIISTKIDSCIIDFFNEGDYSQPHLCPPWYGRPFCILFLTECDVVFGRFVEAGHPGNYKGSLKLSLKPGSLLVMQGKSADFAKHALSSLCKQRILITFAKALPKRSLPNYSSRASFSVPAAPPRPLSWSSPSRPSSSTCHPAAHKHFGAMTPTVVLQAPSIIPQSISSLNGIQPMFMPTPATPPVPFPAPNPLSPASSGCQEVPPPRQSTPQIPLPGTGVFLPGSGHSVQTGVMSSADSSALLEVPNRVENNHGLGFFNYNGSSFPQEVKINGHCEKQQSDGAFSNDSGGKLSGNGEDVFP